MKTITLTKAEAEAWAAGERVVWRRMNLKPQGFDTQQPHEDVATIRETNQGWGCWGKLHEDGRGLLYQHSFHCPYGKPGDEVKVREDRWLGMDWFIAPDPVIAAIRVTQRGDVWGWEMELEERNG